ncbi:hypothetical protein BDF20DRAFT_907297 [Mycotypha africana]|uniref:uncharacterized protein n=1 Tax=Mycotypha africana TaxID=64632 RepID=UPI0023000AF5|nr:uncharacterized protein BDF20DRAFT_907297 [Mycotypha africana]KAI8971595.1 hypothetical protein BDF20DRAFT_907297 [Mycotypha africana]
MNDGRYKYNAAGTLIVNNFFFLSSGYGSNDAGKISFDHHKAMFGILAMIRTVAQLYDKASFNTFTKLKIHFLHAHGNSIRHWSMSTQAPSLYIMTKEQKVIVPVSFFEKDITILPFICFFKTLANQRTKRPQKLSNIINPMIIRLNEGKHASIVAEHGPMSVPSSPIHI